MIDRDILDHFDLYTFNEECKQLPMLRVGQYFINKYWDGESTEFSRKMWQLDKEDAIIAIVQYLTDIQQGGIDYE